MSSSVDSSKWTKNGFGENIPRSTAGGKFSKEESELVRQAVHDFCAARDVSVARLCSECEHKTELKGAWMEIAKTLPHRSVQSVYRHGLRILHPFKRGAWTDEEVQELLDLVARLGKKWIAVQKILNRSADACRDKYREMSEDFTKGRWKDHETELLITLIRQHLRVDPNASIVDIGKMVEAEGIVIPWSTISKKMGNRSRLSCFKKYQKMTGIFSPSDGAKRITVDKQQQQQQQQQQEQFYNPVFHQSASSSSSSTTSSILEDKHDDDDVDDEISAAGVVEGDHLNLNDPLPLEANSSGADMDMYLLSELANSGFNRASEVSWETLRIDDAQERWNEIVMQWQQQEGEEATEDALLTLPMYELAQLLLDRKASAKMAAETVEAVDLPSVCL